MAVKAGKLRHRVKIYKPVTKSGPLNGGSKPTWEHALTLWAEFTPLSVKDVINAKAADSQIRARCKLRYRKDITSKMRLEHMGLMYDIDGDPLPDDNSGREYITLMLKSTR